MKMRILRTAVGLLLLTTSTAWAERGGDHTISIAGGISAPSATSATYQNPAGLVFTQEASVDFHLVSSDDNFSNVTGGAGIYLGNKTIAADIGLDHAFTGGANTAFYGLGFYVPGMKTAIGGQGFTGLSGGGSTFNVGLLIGAFDSTAIGVTCIGVNNSSREFGVGVSLDIGSSIQLAVDGSLNNNLGSPWIQPGLALSTGQAAITVGYGFELGSGGSGSSQITDGVSAGLTLKVGSKTKFSAYYKQIEQFFFGLTIAL